MLNQPLFAPYKLNKTLTLKNRIVMAPMTRNTADTNLVPTREMAAYYARRAEAGLIITEGTIIRPDARGYSNVPGIFTEEQIAGWKKITDRVHENQGLIFSQIWHVGRVTHPIFLDGQLPISSSATHLMGYVKRQTELNYTQARAASITEINDLVDSYAKAAENAMKAGFDGIEIHGANGYLIDQFLHHHTNLRTDDYGGTPQNMARFALEVIKACAKAVGSDRVGVRLSPGGYLHGIVGDTRDAAVFKYLLEELNHLSLAYVHTGNFDDEKTFPELNSKTMTAFIRSHYQGTVIACGGYTLERAESGIKNNFFDLIAFGKPFIANPNLIHLTKNNQPLRPYQPTMLNELF